MATRRPTEDTAAATEGFRPRVDNRPEQIIGIACRLFAKRGYEGTSLRDIAEEAQITKAALYYHFPNKEALYHRIVLDSLRALIDSVRAAVDAAPTPLEKVRQYMLVSADFMDADRDSWMAGSNAFWMGAESEPRTLTIALRNEYETLLRSCIADAINAGEFRPSNIALTGRFLLSALNQISRWHNPKGVLSTREVVEQYLDMALHGLQVQAKA
ncbi:TetR/AcrR family transcriptional regulator [Polaromonas sp.]|uniref:TetR/AcrR family transcriptional regulator n=1 Tax=Polaromonas sp. TaxID=1869339 RepID=UPI003355BC5F